LNCAHPTTCKYTCFAGWVYSGAYPPRMSRELLLPEVTIFVETSGSFASHRSCGHSQAKLASPLHPLYLLGQDVSCGSVLGKTKRRVTRKVDQCVEGSERYRN
jgi:hypothetical protein